MTELTLVQAINRGLSEAMRADPDVLVLGEDVGVNGGVFRATEGLFKEFGESRVIDTPLSEPDRRHGDRDGALRTEAGRGDPVPRLHLSGVRPDRQRARQVPLPLGRSVPLSRRDLVAIWRRDQGRLYHSQSTEAYFCHTAGLKVVIPSTPGGREEGLLLTAIHDEDPVMFLEPKRIYRAVTGEVPDGDHRVPFGKARLVREGSDVSMFAYGAMVPPTVEAAEILEKEGIHAEVIDPRETLVPLDEAAIVASVEKTGCAVVVHEAARFCGFGAELAAILAEKAFYSLKAPIARVHRVRHAVPLRS